MSETELQIESAAVGELDVSDPLPLGSYELEYGQRCSPIDLESPELTRVLTFVGVTGTI